MLNFGFKKEKMKFEALRMKLWASLKQEINQRNARRNFIEASVLEFFELPEDLKKRRKQAEPRANGGFLNLLPIKQPKM